MHAKGLGLRVTLWKPEAISVRREKVGSFWERLQIAVQCAELTMDTYIVTPAPDIEDQDKFEQYITDRRVIGVCAPFSHTPSSCAS